MKIPKFGATKTSQNGQNWMRAPESASDVQEGGDSLAIFSKGRMPSLLPAAPSPHWGPQMFLAWQEKGEVQFLLSTPPKSTKDKDQELMAHMGKKGESFPPLYEPPVWPQKDGGTSRSNSFLRWLSALCCCSPSVKVGSDGPWHVSFVAQLWGWGALPLSPPPVPAAAPLSAEGPRAPAPASVPPASVCSHLPAASPSWLPGSGSFRWLSAELEDT